MKRLLKVPAKDVLINPPAIKRNKRILNDSGSYLSYFLIRYNHIPVLIINELNKISLPKFSNITVIIYQLIKKHKLNICLV